MAAHNLSPQFLPIDRSAETRDNEAFGYENMLAWLAKTPAPTGICCATDSIALGVMAALAHKGYRPGHEVAVAGHDNLSFSAYAIPSLTTVSQPKAEIGREAVTAAIALARRRRARDWRKVLQSDLIIRDSTLLYRPR